MNMTWNGFCYRRMYQGRDFSRISYPQPKWGHQYEYLWVWKELEEKKLRKAEYEAGFSEGEKHGHETGFSEGEKYGIELNSIETARRMLQLQEFSLEKIAAISGLSLDEVKKLQ